jgi:hypothetical protein
VNKNNFINDVRLKISLFQVNEVASSGKIFDQALLVAGIASILRANAVNLG